MVYILMATYNGEKYIEQQIESILNQSYKDIKLVIQDDKSKDGTFSILKKYKAKFPDIIEVTQNDTSSGSSKINFMKLLERHKDKAYVMLSDQDDVWKSNKVEIAMKQICSMEAKYGENIPCLVHTDLAVVDKNLNLIAESLEEYENLDGSQNSLNKFLIQNSVTGCTICINKALLSLIRPEGMNMLMHDGYLGFLAVTFGKIEYINESTILYRQHGGNSVGAKNNKSIKFKLNKFFAKEENKKSIAATYEQARVFFNMYEDKLSESDIKLLMEYINIPNLNKIQRCLTIIRLGTLKSGFPKALGQFLFI